MQRILFTASTFSHIKNFHMPYIKQFKNSGFTVDVACGGSYVDLDFIDNVIPISFEKSITSPKNIKAVKQIHTIIKHNNYNIISCHTSLAAFFTRLALIGIKNRPVIVCISHGYLFDDKITTKNIMLKTAEKIVSPMTDLLLTMNEWDTNFAKANKLSKNIKKINGMGLDSEKLKTHSKQEIKNLKKSLNIKEDDFIIICPAELSKRKSQHTIIRALNLLPQNVVLILAGDGVLHNEYKNLSETIGVAKKIRFVGHVKEMSLYYNIADALVSSSKSEGIPFNIMEAMYYNIPIIATKVKGHTDLLQNSNCAMLYEYEDFEQCAKFIQMLMQKDEFAQEMCNNAKIALEPYMLENVMPQIISEYQKVCPKLKTKTLEEAKIK